MTTAHEAVEYRLYSEQQDVCMYQTSSDWAEPVHEEDLEEERFEMHCLESQTNIESY